MGGQEYALGLHRSRPGRDLNRLRMPSMDMGMPSSSSRSTCGKPTSRLVAALEPMPLKLMDSVTNF